MDQVRTANAPQFAVFDRLLLPGGIIAFHDCYDPHSTHSKGNFTAYVSESARALA